MSDNPFVGSWSYRSFLNDPDLSKDSNMNQLLFGDGTLVITAPSSVTLGGTIGVTAGRSIYMDRLDMAHRRRFDFRGRESSRAKNGFMITLVGWCQSCPTVPTHFRRRR